MKKIVVSFCIVTVSLVFAFAIIAADACEVRGVGYWKNKDIEREAIIVAAAAVSTVFPNEQDLRLYLMLKGKKTPTQKLKRQFGASVLNIAAGLNLNNALYQGEVELVQVFNGTYALGTATIEDAISEIEYAVANNTNLEEARELAEAINNGDYFTACQ